MTRPHSAKPDDFDRPRTSKLVKQGGKVDQREVFLAAEEEARKRREAHAKPAEAIIDEDLVLSPTGDAGGEGAANFATTAPTSLTGDDAIADADVPAEDEVVPQKVVFRLKRDLQKRLDKYLTDRISFMSRAKLQQLIEAGGVTVNARIAKSSTNLRQNDVVEVLVPPPPSPDVQPEDIALNIMYEDEHMIVINKSPDIIVHPARSHNSGTMINALAYHFRHRSPTGGSLSDVGKEFARPGVVHRLDRQTSGVIVFAKSEEAHWKIARQFEARTVDKRYVALVHGYVDPVADVIDLPMGPALSREKGLREKQVIRHDHLGKTAITVYRTLARFTAPAHVAKDRATKDSVTDDRASMHVSLVEVELKTGRTHQIRVHFASRGQPLVGDNLYGGAVLPADPAANWPGVPRVALHAALLTFRHPFTNEELRFAAPLPPDLKNAVKALQSRPGMIEPPPPRGTVLSLAALMG